jgi:hypothetical protein
MLRLTSILGLATLSILLTILSAGCGSESAITQPSLGEQVERTGEATGLVAVQLQTIGLVGDSSAYHDGHGDGPHRGTALSSISLTFDAIRIYPACADSDGVGGNENGNPDRNRHGDCGGSPECGFIEILTDPVTVNLSDLGAGLTEQLGTLDVPTGEYSHLAVHISAAEGTTVDGETVEVVIANRDDMLKVRVPFTVEEGYVSAIVLVIDLSRSVREVPPGSGSFVLIPVLHGENRGQHEPGEGNRHQHGDGHQGEGEGGSNSRHGGGGGGGGGASGSGGGRS